jgi:hypothetical protein
VVTRCGWLMKFAALAESNSLARLVEGASIFVPKDCALA